MTVSKVSENLALQGCFTDKKPDLPDKKFDEISPESSLQVTFH